MKKVALFAVISLLAFTGAAMAQTGSVSGTVVNAAGEPAVGARVSLHDGTTCVDFVLTDGAGAFLLADVPAGTYNLRVGLPRTGQATVEGVEVIDGQTTDVPVITLAGSGPNGPNGPRGRKGPRPCEY